MKKVTLFLPLLLLFGFLLTSCETNEPKVPDNVRQSIKGNYSGQVNLISSGNNRDTLRIAALATVNDKEINIDRVPVGAMIDTIFGSGTATTSGINTLPMKIKYTMYAANQAYFPMTFEIADFNFTVNWKPVGVYIKEAHKNRHHDTAIMEVGILVYFFNHHNLAIGRSHNHLLCLSIEHTDGTAKEVNDDAIGYAVYHQKRPKGHFTLKKHP